MARIDLTALRKCYGANEVVHGVDVTVADGEFLVLVGPSGCGKSTILRMIAGLETVTSGEVAIDHEVVNELEPKDRDIAMVFQNYALYPHMSVYKNMAYGLKVRGVEKGEIDRRVREASAVLGLNDYLNRKPRALSGGQRQRVAMGRALVRDPKVFLFDEPLSNLDAKLRNQMRVELKQLHGQLGNTFVYVTHDQVEAMTLGQRIMVLRDGTVEQIGTPHEIYNRPASAFVAEFIGSPGMNLLAARGHGSSVCVDGLAFAAEFSMPERVTLGVRPEKITLGESGACRTDAVVQLVEPLGGHCVVHCRMNTGDTLILLADPCFDTSVGETVSLCLDPAELHVFDSVTGDRIDTKLTV